MKTTLAFLMGEKNRDRERMVFDWRKAAEIIAERKPERAFAGLSSDLEWTGGVICERGCAVTDSYTYLASTWARPVLILNDDYDGEIECFLRESEAGGWDENTKWPDEAIAILEAAQKP